MLQNAFAALSTDETSQTMLYLLALIADKLGRLDTADRLAVNVETGSITASLAASQTLTTLTTCSTVTAVTSIQNMGTTTRATDFMPHNIAQMGTLHLYNNITVS